MLCAIYMAAYDSDCQNEDPIKALDTAIAKIKRSRSHVELESDKYQKALEAIQVLQKLESTKLEEKKSEHKEEFKLSDENLNSFFASIQTKIEIAELTSFKELAIYAASLVSLTGEANRKILIRDFFQQICQATNASWYHNYFRIMQPFLEATPTFAKQEKYYCFGSVKADREARRDLVAAFHVEITSYLKMKGYKPGLELEEIKPTPARAMLQ